MYKVQIDNADGGLQKYDDIIKKSFPHAKICDQEFNFSQKYNCGQMSLNEIMKSIIKFHELDKEKNELILDFDDYTEDKAIRITIYDSWVE